MGCARSQPYLVPSSSDRECTGSGWAVGLDCNLCHADKVFYLDGPVCIQQDMPEAKTPAWGSTDEDFFAAVKALLENLNRQSVMPIEGEVCTISRSMRTPRKHTESAPALNTRTHPQHSMHILYCMSARHSHPSRAHCDRAVFHPGQGRDRAPC